MEKNHVKPNSLLELDFLTDKTAVNHVHGDIEMLYIINGHVSVTIGEDQFSLNPRDILVINANRHHAYSGTENIFIGRFLISLVKLREMLGQNTVLFWCNSAVDDHDAFDELRIVINRILNHSLEKNGSVICRESLYYQLLHILSSNFLVPQEGYRSEGEISKDDDRMQDIFAYIRANYNQNIRLQDLAGHLYLSETYVSKYIKSKCGINFVDLVNQVRLEYAVDELIHSDLPIIKIAMDNGFASVAAFNKCFKSAYSKTPSEFRRQLRQQIRTKENALSTQTRDALIRERVTAYLEQSPMLSDEGNMIKREVRADALATPMLFDKQSCLGIINAGTLMDLLNSSLQSQIVSSQKRLGFRYVRFWNCFGAETNIDIHIPAEQQNFGRLDTVLDFLIRNDLKPYFELGRKPIRLLKNASLAVHEERDTDQEFLSDGEMHDFYNGFIRHLIRRYGSDEVRTWYFEYHEQEEIQFTDLSFHFSPMTEKGHERYFERFDILAKTLRDVLPSVRLGGSGFPLQHYGAEGFRNILRQWTRHKYTPSFLSITSYPYQLEKENGIYYERRSTNMDFILHNIRLAKKVMAELSFPTQELHVSEYGLSLSNRNAINDSCYKGAFLMQNIISCMEERDVLLGHWLFSDLYADYRDTNVILFGGGGLLNKNGIPKPSWYAFDFANACYTDVIYRDKNCVITRNSNGAYRIICHNLKNLSYNYYVTPENEISAKEIPQMLENREALTIHIRITHVQDGTYLLRQKKINQSSGSIQEEWMDLNMEPDLSMMEIQHIQKITTYNLTMRKTEAINGELTFDLMLKPNEITHVYLLLQ